MKLGEVVDFVKAYNERQKQAEENEKKPKKRRASQDDINAFFG